MLRNGPRVVIGYRKDGRPIFPIAGGSEPAVETEAIIEPPQEAQGQEPQAGETQENKEEPSGNPAWQEFLDVLPTQLHSQVTPLLEKWDKGVQQRFEAIHGEYEPYKAFKEQSVDPDTINYALGIVKALEEDPRQVYDGLAEYYKFENAQQQQPPVVDPENPPQGEWNPETGEYTDPRVSQLEQNFNLLAQYLLSEEQAKAQAAEDTKIDAELKDLRTKYGDYDEKFVLGLMLNGETPENAIKEYQTVVEKIRADANRPAAPKVIGAGGSGVATKSVNPATLTETERKAMVAEMLKNAKSAEG